MVAGLVLMYLGGQAVCVNTCGSLCDSHCFFVLSLYTECVHSQKLSRVKAFLYWFKVCRHVAGHGGQLCRD